MLFDLLTAINENECHQRKELVMKLQKKAKSHVLTILDSPPVRDAWTHFLQQMFHSPKTQEALRQILVSQIHNQYFQIKLTNFSKDLISEAVTSARFQVAAKQMVSNCVPTAFAEEYKPEKDFIPLASDLMQSVHLRSDLLSVMGWQISVASCESVQQIRFGESLSKAIGDGSVKRLAK